MPGPNFCPNCGHQLVSTPAEASSPVMVIDENFVFNFGKYRGMSVKQVLADNPAYLFWVNRSIEWLEVPEDILIKAGGTALKPQPQPRPRGGLWVGDTPPGHFDDDPDDDIPF